MIDSEELLGQLHAYANNRHHSFVTLQQMARESAAAIEELRAQIAVKDVRLAAWEEYAGAYFMIDDARAYMHLVRLVRRGETAAPAREDAMIEAAEVSAENRQETGE